MLAAGITSTAELANKLPGITPQTIRKWLRSEEPTMTAQNLMDLAIVLNVRVFWLGYGEGPIHRFTAAKYTESDLIEAFRALPEPHRKFVRDMIGLLAKHQDDQGLL